MLNNQFKSDKKRKPWPADCPWPEPFAPGEGVWWDLDLVDMLDLDEEGEMLLGIKEYYDDLVDEHVLNADYSFNKDYEFKENLTFIPAYHEDGDDDDDDLEFFPEIGEEYWFDGFDVQMWEEDLTDHLNLLKLGMYEPDPVAAITESIGYKFINENLLRQAFTRRAFATEYGLPGCSEELEFIGDSVLNMVVTRDIVDQLTEVVAEQTEAPFVPQFREGEFSKIRSKFVNKEHLSACAVRSGLDQYILYGSSEEACESSREDMIEALIGAVAIDSSWDWEMIGAVVDRIICVQLGQPHLLLKQTFYDLFNAWHQKHFGCMPEYHITQYAPYWCSIKFSVPANDKGVETSRVVDARGITRSQARELAAEMAYRTEVAEGLWINLKDAGIIPNLDDSINQLQELYQKKYVEDKPEYAFHESYDGTWRCDCECGGVAGLGNGPNKTAAKKQAAYMALTKLYEAAGI